ncbi:MAG: TonB-dependent receptor domain-containing protein [bacterium]
MKKLLTFALCILFPVFAVAQHAIKGKVQDSTGEPLYGVNILEKGTFNGTSTNLHGEYNLRVSSPNAVLVFSYIGYATQQVTLEGQTELDITLEQGIIQLGDIQVVGSRSYNRTAIETPVAVDIIEIRDVTRNSGQLDINQLLQYVAPSFNATRQSGADGADHIDPATLRGLGPDQTLVLINGKRRHQSSLINIFGSRGRGNTGTDLNTIPAAAIERIEILRDGASAQYGSDAIAGVINVVLKSSVEEFTGSVTSGVNKADPGSDFKVLVPEDYDGESYNVSGNYGIRIGESGFTNFTIDYLAKNRTNRPADPAAFDIYRQQFGDASADNFAAIFNSGIAINENTRFYAFGGFNHRFTDAFAWTRDPDSNRNIPTIYPTGFNPHITSNITDKSISAGIRTQVKGWDLDFNNTFGSNRFHYIIDGTLNASLLEKSPTRFDAGGFQLSQNTTGLNLSRFFPNLFNGVNIALGVEYRIDNYEIFAGEEGSWKNYGIVDTVINGVVSQIDVLGRPGGSQGFPGFQPSNELDEFRTNLGGYVDAEFDFTDKFMIGAAVRFEDYSDFGSTVNGKLASRLSLTDGFALRASVSSGFRAPSLAQIYFNSTFTDFVAGVPVDKLIAKNDSPITRALGIPKLKEETAVNASVGFTASFGSFTATVDGYIVDIKDRIVLTGAFEDTDPDIGAELQVLNVGAAQFFTNAIDTQTKGLDVVLSWSTLLGNNSRIRATFAGNFNDMELGDITTSPKLKGKEDIYFGSREQKFLLASAPDNKINLTIDYKINRFSANLRFVRFGEVVLEDWLGTNDVYKSKAVTDLTVGYDLSNNLSLHLGAANLFNVYPSQQDTETETGGVWDAVQMGFSGTFYFTRLGFKF